MTEQQEEQENNNVAPRSRLRKKKPWEEDLVEQGHAERKKSIGPAPTISPINVRRNRTRPWSSEHDARTLSSYDDDEGSLGDGELDTSFGECHYSSSPQLRNNNSSTELKVDELEEAHKVLAPTKKKKSTPAPIVEASKPVVKPNKSSKKSSSSSSSSGSSSGSTSSTEPFPTTSTKLPKEQTLAELTEENKELLAIDFVRDGDALREAIAEDVLAMWEDQGLYQDMPDLRTEILKGIVQQKFEALRQEQARVLEKKQLLSMPKLAASSEARMSIIAEEEEEEEEEEAVNTDIEEPTLEELEANMTAEEKSAFRAFRVQEELERRLQQMDRSEQNCVEASGRLGDLTENEMAVHIRDYHAWNKYKLHHALQQRVSKIFTGDHLITTSFEEYDDDEEDDENELDKDDNAEQDLKETTEMVLTQEEVVEEEEEYEEEEIIEEESKNKVATKAKVRETLTNSFSKFDALLAKKNQPVVAENDDEWTECEELTVVEEPTPLDLKKVVADMDAKLKAVTGSKDDDEASFTEYTVHEEITVHEDLVEKIEEVDVDELSEQKEKEDKAKTSPIPRVLRPTDKRSLARLQSNDSSYIEMTVADGIEDDAAKRKPGSLDNALNKQQSWGRGFPSITVDDVDDDEMTQLTFDNTMAGEYSTTPDHALASAYLKNTSESARVQSTPPRKTGSITDSQTMQTFPMDELSVSQRGTEGSLESGSRDASAFLSKQVSKILRVEIWSPKEKVVQSAMERLANAASQGTHQRANIARLGGIIAIVRSMQSHPRNINIQVSACQALAHLSVDNESQEAICEVGGRRAIVSAMEAHYDVVEVQQAGCRALASITRPMEGPGMSDSEEEEDGACSGGGVVRVIVNAMNKHPQDPEVQAKAFGALANLCLDNRERLQELSDTGGLTSMTMALQKPWQNRTEQHEAISTLSILLRSLAELGSASF